MVLYTLRQQTFRWLFRWQVAKTSFLTCVYYNRIYFTPIPSRRKNPSWPPSNCALSNSTAWWGGSAFRPPNLFTFDGENAAPIVGTVRPNLAKKPTWLSENEAWKHTQKPYIFRKILNNDTTIIQSDVLNKPAFCGQIPELNKQEYGSVSDRCLLLNAKPSLFSAWPCNKTFEPTKKRNNKFLGRWL